MVVPNAIYVSLKQIDTTSDVVLYNIFSIEEKDEYLVTPSGRKIRKPARFREIYQATDDAVKQVDPGLYLTPSLHTSYY